MGQTSMRQHFLSFTAKNLSNKLPRDYANARKKLWILESEMLMFVENIHEVDDIRFSSGDASCQFQYTTIGDMINNCNDADL